MIDCPHPRPRRSWPAVVAVAAMALSGCAYVHGIPPLAQPTGEPLALDVRHDVHSYMTQEKVAEVSYQGANGQSAGRAEIFRDKKVTYTKLEWRPRQGATPISDESLFRIAGDPDAADAIHDRYRSGWIVSRAGSLVTAVALGLLGASFPLHNARMGRTGLILLPVGGITAGVGFAYLSPDDHLFPYDRAEMAVRAYNKALPPSGNPTQP
jgi:hypothetical protein